MYMVTYYPMGSQAVFPKAQKHERTVYVVKISHVWEVLVFISVSWVLPLVLLLRKENEYLKNIIIMELKRIFKKYNYNGIKVFDKM